MVTNLAREGVLSMSNLLNAVCTVPSRYSVPPTRKTVTESLRLKVPIFYPTGKPFFESIPQAYYNSFSQPI